MNRSIRWSAVLALLMLLALAQVEHGRALFAIIWRVAVVSWDNPATQVLEDTASQTLPHTDPSRLSHDHARLAARPSGRPAAPEARETVSPALSARLTRSPPPVPGPTSV
jgi:hypothetical protein